MLWFQVESFFEVRRGVSMHAGIMGWGVVFYPDGNLNCVKK